MRMKKIMIIAVAAIALVACSKTFDHNKSEGSAIGFGTWTETLTKARANGTSSFVSGDAFEVYGTKTVSSTKQVVFHNVDVAYNGSVWDYAPHRFWDPAASQYDFYAVMPKDILVAEANAGDYAKTGLFTSDDITFGDPTANSNDIMVADHKVCEGSGTEAPYSYSAFQTDTKVQLSFNHVATGVTLKVKQDNNLGDATVIVTALSLLNISNKGHFTVSEYSTNVPTVAWTAATSPTTLGSGEYTILSSSSDTDDVPVAGKTPYTSHAAGETTGTPATLFENYVFMPQNLDAATQKIKMSYTVQVGTETPNVYTDVLIPIANFQQTDTDNNSGTKIGTWAPKTKYEYTITIGANVIEFTATVKAWETTTPGYYYLVN